MSTSAPTQSPVVGEQPKSLYSASRIVGAYDLPDGWVQFKMAVSRGQPRDELYGSCFGRFNENGKMLEWSVRAPACVEQLVGDVKLS